MTSSWLTGGLFIVIGIVGVVATYFFFDSRGTSRRAAVEAAVEAVIGSIRRQAQQLDAGLMRQLIEGAQIDQAVTEFSRARAALLPNDRENPANWTLDDLEVYRKNQLDRGIEEANRKTLVPAVTTALGIVTLTIVVTVVQYSFVASNGASGPVGPSAKAAELPAPIAPHIPSSHFPAPSDLGNPPSTLPAPVPPTSPLPPPAKERAPSVEVKS